MSTLKYSVYPGYGEWAVENLSYSQAVRVGDRIECSGQGGWVISKGGSGEMAIVSGIDFPKDIAEEIAQAFRNVETALKQAGGKGWSQVFRVNSYHTDVTPEVSKLMADNFRKYMPDHKPIWTEIGVKKLGAEDMHVEIEVSAYDPEGAEVQKNA